MKKLFLIILTLVLALSALTPATALANDSKHAGSTSFSGSGLIYVTYMPDPAVKGDIWRYKGEIAEGYLDQCDWELLAGTAFWSKHDSVVKVDSATGNAEGVMTGTFTLSRTEGVLKGTFTGKISGNLYTGDISDAGTWKSTSGTGVFKNVKASGQWSAELSFGPIPGTDKYTLIGPVAWNGEYISLGKTPHIGKPGDLGGLIKPKSIIKPWKPFKP